MSEAATATRAGAIHGVALVLGGAGVLLRGRSAAGKSRLAEEAADAARQRGWFGRLVADDRVLVSLCGGRLVLSPHTAIAGQVERRGQGIFDVDHEGAAVLRLVIDLVDRDRASDMPARMPTTAEQTALISGIAIPRLVLAIGEPGAVQAILERIDEIGA